MIAVKYVIFMYFHLHLQASAMLYEYMHSEMVRELSADTTQMNSCNSLFAAGVSMGKVLAHRLTCASVPFAEAKDAVKFVCKDLWVYNFRQQASRLQANRKGVFMIHDSNFPLLQSLSRSCVVYCSSSGETSRSADDGAPVESSNRMDPKVSKRALELIQFPAGVIQGFLEACGFASTVEPTLPGTIPACAFGITVNELESTVLQTLRSEPGSASI